MSAGRHTHAFLLFLRRRVFPSRTLFDVSSVFLLSRLLSVWKESRRGPVGSVHSVFFTCHDKSLISRLTSPLGRHARARALQLLVDCSPRVLCNLCSTSQQQGKWQQTRERDADAAEGTQSRLRRRDSRFPAKATQWEPEAVFYNPQWELWAAV